MVDLFPHVRATLEADEYFELFSDTQGRFKVFIHGEAPSLDSPFITVEMQPGPEHQLNKCADPFVSFHVTGLDTQRPELWEIARTIVSIFQATTAFAAVGSDAPLQYQLV